MVAVPMLQTGKVASRRVLAMGLHLPMAVLEDDGDNRRRRRPGDLYCKPQSRALLSGDDDDDEITDSADEGGEEGIEQPPQQKQIATELFTPPDSFQSVPSVYEASSSSGHPILKPLSPTSLSVGYGAELAANRVPDGGEHRERTPTLDSPHPSEDRVSSGGLLSPEITILQQVMFQECSCKCTVLVTIVFI